MSQTRAREATGLLASPQAAARWVQLRASRFLGKDAYNSILGLVDQIVVSGTRFATTILVGRLCGVSQLGAYALGFLFVMAAMSVQESLISVPYTVLGNRHSGLRRLRYSGSALVHALLLAVLVATIAGIAAVLLSVFGGPADLLGVLWAMVIVLPVFILHEFVRRFAFADLRMSLALGLDLVVATVQLSCIIALGLLGGLSAAIAYACLGCGCAVSALGWLVCNRRRFAIKRRLVMLHLRRNVSFGRWVFGGKMTVVALGNAGHWMLALMVGAAATGVFTACETVVLLANPLLLGINNVLTPSLSRIYASDGKRGVRTAVRRPLMLMALATATLALMLVFVGAHLVELLYGTDFSGYQWTVAIVAVAMIADGIIMVICAGLWAINRPNFTFVGGLLALVTTLVAMFVLVPSLGVLGAAFGVLAGKAVAVAVQCLAFHQSTKPDISGEAA